MVTMQIDPCDQGTYRLEENPVFPDRCGIHNLSTIQSDQYVNKFFNHGICRLTTKAALCMNVRLARPHKTAGGTSNASTRSGSHVEIDAAMKRPPFETSLREPANAG